MTACPGRRFAILVSLAVVMSTASGLGATPLDDRVRGEIARRLPGWWRIERIQITAPDALAGLDAGASSRVEAEVRLTTPTFLVEFRAGPDTLVRRAGEPGAVKLLTGEAKAPRKGAIEVTLDDAPAVWESLGKPETALPGRVLPIDGAEGRALVAALPERERERARAAESVTAAVAAADAAEAKAQETIGAAIDARGKRLSDLIARLGSRDRAERLAATREAAADPDPTRRALAIDTALRSRDPIEAGAALRDWLTRRRTIPVLLYPVKEEPDSAAVARNIGPLTLTISSIDESGGIGGSLSAPGYGVTRDATAGGGLTRTDLSIVTYGCALTLRLTELPSLDGVYRCQTLPPLAARVTLD